MGLKNTKNHYGSISMALHWIMAFILIGLLILGLYMIDVPIGIKKLRYYRWHKEIGILILMLVFIRLLWRAGNVLPPMPLHVPKWQALAAYVVHYAFYGLMILLPITGWMLSSSAGLPVSFFGLFVLPDLVLPSEALRHILTQMHQWLAYGLIAILCGHVGAAMFHHFYYKDDILRRMLPWS